MDIKIPYIPNKKQELFHKCGAGEVVYGGAKGGGKSTALVMESFKYGSKYPRADMYLFRETYDDLEANLIQEWKNKIDKNVYNYNESKHIVTLANDTTIKFRYIRNFTDAEGYQGRSIDFIGVDELTKHEEKSIQVLLSCLRSAKGFPTKFKGTCNPGGIGHNWVKKRYINATDYGKKRVIDSITGVKIAFIPALVYDNDILMKNDPNYVRRLENLPESQKKAFLYGDWDIYDGQYFDEFKHDIHVIEPFEIPSHWRRYFVMDYGLDMFAGYFIAMDDNGRAYVYKELYQSGLIISDMVQMIKANITESIYEFIAPPDMWNRNRDTGKSVAEIALDNGVFFNQASNERVAGWLNMKEWLKPYNDEHGSMIAGLRIFNCCPNLIESIPALQYDDKNLSDVSKQPHIYTHGPDAIRYFIAGRPAPAISHKKEKKYNFSFENPKPNPLGKGNKTRVI